MIKAKVIKPFYCAKDKELYLDEDRYNELKELGLVEEVEEYIEITSETLLEGKKIYKEIIKNSKIEKATNDKTRVLSD